MRAVVLALTVALVASQQIDPVPRFTPGQTYVYKYEALLLGGLPMDDLARAGVKVNSKVLISALSETTMLLKLENPEIFEYSGVWPKDAFVPAAKLVAVLNAQLQIPIKFEYTNGVVGKVFAPAGVSATVLNLHRGILNILQLNLKKTQTVYEMQEMGAQGTCKTHYVITHRGKDIEVAKSKDLTNCQERIMKDIGFAYMEKCVECQQEGQSLAGTANYIYTMKPVAGGTQIHEVKVHEIHQFSPFNIRNGAAQMEAKQTLAFIETQKKPIVPVAGDYLARGSLEYEFATEILQTPIQLLRISNAQTQIVDHLQHLVTYNMDQVHEDAPLKFVQLIQLLRVATFETLEAIWAQFKDKPIHRRWILDAIPAVGNTVAFRLVKENFVAGEFTTAEFAQVLLAAVHMANADMGIVKMYSELALHPKVQELPVLREAAMLGYGTLIAKYCAAFPTCPAELMKPIHEAAFDAIAKTDVARITLLLKVMGNAGHPVSLKPITKLLPGFGTAAAAVPASVQIDAIMALRSIAKRDPKQVQPVALQLLMDTTLYSEQRMTACIVLFETKPSMALISTVVGALKKETNMQVMSFTYSHMKHLTRSTAPDLAPVAAGCNVAIKLLSPKLDRLSYRFSKAIHLDYYYNPLMAGAAASAFIVNDAATILPRAVVAKARTYIAGAAADVLEFGVRTEGIQEALLKSPVMTENNDRISKMRRAIQTLKQWRALPKDQPLASFYIKFFGQEMAFAHIDRTVVDQAINFASSARTNEWFRMALTNLQSGINFQYAKPLLAAEIRRIFPTAVGLPMELSAITAAVATAAVNVQGVITPAIPETVTFADFMRSDIQLRAEVKPSIAMQTFAVMGVNTAFIQAAVMARAYIRTVVPGKIAVRADLPKYNFKMEVLPVATPGHVAAVRFDTLAVARNIGDLGAERVMPIIPMVAAEQASFSAGSIAGGLSRSSEIIYPDVEPMTGAGEAIHKHFCLVVPYVGVKACLDFTTSNTALFTTYPLLNILGQHAASIAVEPAEGPAVEKVEFEIQIGAQAAEKLLKEVDIIDDDMEENSMLMKLKEILVSGLKNNSFIYGSSSSSSSSSSRASVGGSSSSSSSRASMGMNPVMTDGDFTRHHIHLHAIPLGASHSRRSSAASFEDMQKQARYLENVVPPTAAIIFRIVRADRMMMGYQVAAYIDKAAYRCQLIMSSIAEADKWRMCTDAAILSKNKAMAKFAWGVDCQDYEVVFKAETGVYRNSPAARMEMEWVNIPNLIAAYGRRLCQYVPGAALLAGISVNKARNPEKQISVIVAVPTERAVDIALKTPRMLVHKMAVDLPISVPVVRDAMYRANQEENLYDAFQSLYGAATSAQCSMVKDTLMTFNNRKYVHNTPLSCYQVLAQDCTPELKFMIMMKKDELSEENHLNVKIADIDVDLCPIGSHVIAKVNGIEVSGAQYQHPTGSIKIRKNEEGMSLYAPSHGLQEVFFAKGAWKIKVVDWMRGKTCGLCGMADGEIRQEYRTPSGYVTKSPVNFAHSWVLPAENCEDPNQCRMRLESVKLEKQMIVDGMESKCYSVEPVLRCLPGCVPVKTTPVTVGYHCVPIDSNQNISESSSNMNYVNVRETAEAHVACHCTEQCA